jgi:hypothetical protein
MPFPIYGQRPTVLLTVSVLGLVNSSPAKQPSSAVAAKNSLTNRQNDDGPPSVSSPNIFTFSKALQAAGFDVKVVVPTGQMSW